MMRKNLGRTLGLWAALAILLPQLALATHREGHNPPGLDDNDAPGQSDDDSQGRGNSGSKRNNILFRLQDKVNTFNLTTGAGVQVGTATGKIEGVSITHFKFNITSGSGNFTLDNRAGITDTDGDQIIFKVTGTGHFITSPLKDTPSTPQAQLVLGGLGGPVTGTYEVMAVSGKYVGKYRVGERFPFSAVGYNVNPAVAGSEAATLGAVYVEVFSNSDDD